MQSVTILGYHMSLPIMSKQNFFLSVAVDYLWCSQGFCTPAALSFFSWMLIQCHRHLWLALK